MRKIENKREVATTAVEAEEFKLGRRLDQTQIEDGKYYYTGEIERRGPKAWHYHRRIYRSTYSEMLQRVTYSEMLFCGAEFMNPAWAKDFYEISEEEFRKYLDGYNRKKYGKGRK